MCKENRAADHLLAELVRDGGQGVMEGVEMEDIVLCSGMKKHGRAMNSKTCHVHTHHKVRVRYVYTRKT